MMSPVHGVAIGFAPGTVDTAFARMRASGGHATRHLERVGLIPRTGSLAQRVEAFRQLVTPILERPIHAFNWRVGDTAGRAFAGLIGGQWVFVIVAKEGPYQDTVLTAFVPDARQLALMQNLVGIPNGT